MVARRHLLRSWLVAVAVASAERKKWQLYRRNTVGNSHTRKWTTLLVQDCPTWNRKTPGCELDWASYPSKLMPRTRWHHLCCWLASSWGTHRRSMEYKRALQPSPNQPNSSPYRKPVRTGTHCWSNSSRVANSVSITTWNLIAKHDGENVIRSRTLTHSHIPEGSPGPKFRIIILVWTRTKCLWCSVKTQTEHLCIEWTTRQWVYKSKCDICRWGSRGDTFRSEICRRRSRGIFVPSCECSGPTGRHWGHPCRSTNIGVCEWMRDVRRAARKSPGSSVSLQSFLLWIFHRLLYKLWRRGKRIIVVIINHRQKIA